MRGQSTYVLGRSEQTGLARDDGLGDAGHRVSDNGSSAGLSLDQAQRHALDDTGVHDHVRGVDHGTRHPRDGR